MVALDGQVLQASRHGYNVVLPGIEGVAGVLPLLRTRDGSWQMTSLLWVNLPNQKYLGS